MLLGVLAMIVYIGGYTDADHANGLYVLDVDAKTGEMTHRGECAVPYAIYNVLSPDGKIMYSCRKGGVSSFAVNGYTIKKIADADLEGTPCHVTVFPNGKKVAWADYSGAQAGSFDVADGLFSNGVCHRHTGRGPNLPRQDKAHCHQATPTPDGRGYVICDLGLDQLVTYRDGESDKPFQIFQTLPRGAGPRHMIFHPNGKLAFVLFELGSLVASFEWNADTGFVRMLDQCQTLEKWPSGRAYNGDLAAAVRFTPDGRRLVVSNRGEQSLVVFDIDVATGALTFHSRFLLPGSWPRDFAFLDDTLAIVTMERSNEVHTLRYDAEKGTFALLKTLDGFYRPVAALRVQ